jgi:hypothetical protein
MALAMNQIGELSLEISTLISEKVSRLQGSSLYKPGSSK